MSELLPCPFCGGEAQVQHQSRELYGDVVDWYGVYCMKQFCGYVSGQRTEAEAIEAWNTRADDYKQAAEYWQRMYEQSFTEEETVTVVTGITTVTDTPQITYVPERICHNTHENRWFKCSACGYGFTDLYADDEHDIDEQPKYCPNCGAKVVSE